MSIESIQSRSPQAIHHPFARDASGKPVHITTAKLPGDFVCFSCAQPMLAKRGSRRAWHFAHKPPVAFCSTQDQGLRDTAIALIQEGFAEAQRNHTEFNVGCPCSDCGITVTKDLATAEHTLVADAPVIPDATSPLAFYSEHGVLAIEFATLREFPPLTRTRYQEQRVPAMVLRPTWTLLPQLTSGLTSADTINFPAVRCQGCTELNQAQRMQPVNLHAEVHDLLARMDQPRFTNSDALPFQPWSHDRFDQPMFRPVQREVFTKALILTLLGFNQSRTKPWLFVFPVRYDFAVFADFGSTEDIPIWQLPHPLVYCTQNSQFEQIEADIIRGALNRCRASGADVRVSFYAQDRDPGEPTQIPGPIAVSAIRTYLPRLMSRASA